MGIRKKKILFILFSVVFWALFLNLEKLTMLFGNKIMSVDVVSEGELAGIIANKKAVDWEGAVKYDKHSAAYDIQSHTLFVPQTLAGHGWEGKLETEYGKLYFLDDAYLKDKESAMSEGHVFKLYQVRDQEYDEYQVVFTGMPVMTLFEEKTEGEEGSEIMYGVVQVYDQYHTSMRFQSEACTFHIRGGSSRGYEKKSYKLELENRDLSLLGMRKDDDWILNALYDDAGLIHNKVSAQVWEEIALNGSVKNSTGASLEYVELFLNNEYQGVYALTERIDKKELSLKENDILYKCRAYRIPEEHNYSNEETDEMRPVFLLKYPKDYEEEDWNPIKTWVDYYVKGGATSFQEGMAFLNMENTLDYNLFCMLINGTDNLRKNIFFLAEYQSDGTYQFIKIPWDLNATWGNPWVDQEECNYTLYDPDSYNNVSAWTSDASALYYLDKETVSYLMRERWNQLRSKEIISKEKIFKILDEQFGYLHASGAYGRNYSRWQNGAECWQDSYIYEYVEKRIDFLDQYFDQLYEDVISPKIFDGIDYSEEFDTRYYWEENRATLKELYSYDPGKLLEHYVLYGKPFELKGIYDGGKFPEVFEESDNVG
ncbi:MAG: CotH kinase family protein [Lachnospiraceae bacterium]|nr:CotH kinase family protein [Lachnospiraceae bacterium]